MLDTFTASMNINFLKKIPSNSNRNIENVYHDIVEYNIVKSDI